MDSQTLIPHLRDLERRAASGTFLTPAQAAEARRVFGARVILDGGFEEAERVIPVFAQDYVREKYLAAVELRFRPQDQLSHRDILGAALALGLERSVFGDIAIEEGQAIVICLPRIADFIAENLVKAGKIGLRAVRIPLSSLPEPRKHIREQRGTVASLRLDALLAEAFRLSRGAAEEKIRAGLVQLNHELCDDGARRVKEGDIFSLRGKGRVKLLEAGGESRKGRLWVTVGHYE